MRTRDMLSILVLASACGGGGSTTAGFGTLGGSAAEVGSDAGTSGEEATGVDPSGGASTSATGDEPTTGVEEPTTGGATGDTTEVDPSAGTTGAPPNGTVDASEFPSIQDAIDSLEGIGGAVYIPAGVHEISEKLRVHSHITVFGAGMDVTIIRFQVGVPVDHMISNDSSSGLEAITIRELTLQGPGPGPGINDCCYGLKLEHVTGALVAGVAARDHGRDGFYLGYKHVDGVPQGVFDARLSGVVATGNGRNGLSIVQGQNVVVDGGTFTGNNTHEAVAAIDLEPDPYPDGFVKNCRLIGNTVEGNANNGIQLYAEGGAIVADNAVCYNTLKNNAGTGIADTQADNDVFVGNTFDGNGAEADYDGSALVGDQYAGSCGVPLPELPPLPPLP